MEILLNYNSNNIMETTLSPPIPSTSDKLKILCLHGYKQNGTIFKSKTAVLRKSMKDIAEFVYIDAPHIIDESKGTASWWRASKDGKEYRGWDTTIDFLREIFINQGPFDGVLGFSQGAVLASLLCSISSLNSIESSSVYDGFSLKFGLLFSGFQSRATIHSKFYPSSCNNSLSNSTNSTNNNSGDEESCNSCNSSPTTTTTSSSSSKNYPSNKINTPSLHVWGKTDELVTSTNCESLSSQFSHPHTYVHEHGHLIPTSKIDIQNYRNFLISFLKDVHLE